VITRLRKSNQSRSEEAKKKQKAKAQKDPAKRPWISTADLRKMPETETTGGLSLASALSKDEPDMPDLLTRRP
jgi:hypothetical protein